MRDPLLSAAQAAPILAHIGEALRPLSAEWRDLPPQEDLSRQAMAARLDALHTLEWLYRRSLFEGIVACAQARLGEDLDASEKTPRRAPRLLSVRPATATEELSLVPLSSALVEAAAPEEPA